MQLLLDLFLYFLKCALVYKFGLLIFDIIKLIYVYFLAPRLGLGFDFKRCTNKWAVVTGSTDGIGKEYLLQLAMKGLRKFVLISRDSQKLEATASWLSESYPDCEIKIQPFTFGRDDYIVIRQALETLDIGILVNNAGAGPERMFYFAEDPITDKMVYKVNTESVFEMMQLVLPTMREARFGAIVNVSSVQSIRPIALLSSYSSSKAYITHLSACTEREYEKFGVTIQCLIPILVETKILQYRHDDILEFDQFVMVQPKKFAQEAISTLGLISLTTGSWWQEIQLAFINFFPWWMLRLTAEPYYQGHKRRLDRGYDKK